MGFTTPIAALQEPAQSEVSIWSQGDAAWAQKAVKPKEAQLAMEWPADLMASFCLQMAHHRMPINRTKMVCERRYAVQQLMLAYTAPDRELHKQATALFFHFEERLGVHAALH